MATQELLKASYNGSLGETTGSKWKSRDVVKGRIWSKTPNNETQTKSVRAFEALNRVASAIAKQWFYWLGIKAANMHKHNAVAHLLKECVFGHVFDPVGFESVFAQNGTVRILSQSVDYDTGEISIKASTTYSPATNRKQSWLILVFTQVGKVLYCASPATTSVDFSFFAPIVPGDTVYIMALSSDKSGKKPVLGISSDFPLYQNGCFFSSRSLDSVWRFVAPGRAVATGAGVSYSNGRATVTG